MPAHWAIAHGKAWQEIWGTGPDQGLGKLRHRHEQEGPMGDIVKDRLKQEGGPQCGVPGVPRYRGGVGANPSDVWVFAGLQHTQQAPHTTRLVKQWMEFLKDNRPPREWCRSVPGSGFLHEEGYGSTVLYRKGTNVPLWLQNQADQFSRMVRHFDDKANNRGDPDAHGRTAENYRDAAEIVTQPRGAKSNLPGFFGGRFGRGGPGSDVQDVLDLIARYVRHPDTNAIVIDYVATLNPEVTPFDISNSSHGPVSRRKHQWLEILTPAYDRLIYDFDAYGRRAGATPRGLAKIQRIRQQMDLPDGVRLLGRVRSLRGAPGVPPIDLRDWFLSEKVRGSGHGVPAYYDSAKTYLQLVVQTWRDIPGFIRRSGGSPSAGDPRINRMNGE